MLGAPIEHERARLLPSPHTTSRLWSLWEVLRRYAESFYHVGNALGFITSYVADDSFEQEYPERAKELKLTVAQNVARAYSEEVERTCAALDLEFAVNAARRLRKAATKEDYGSPTLESIRSAVQEVDHIVRDELAKRELFFVPSDRAHFYNEPLSGWGELEKAFPSAVFDAEEAAKCLALDRGTACVFHCMRILQIGMASMARAMNASITNPEDQNWSRVIESINARLREVQPGYAKASEMSEDDRRFFAQPALQFMYFKDAFRNYVMHRPMKFDAKGAESVFNHTRETMALLATRLTE